MISSNNIAFIVIFYRDKRLFMIKNDYLFSIFVKMIIHNLDISSASQPSVCSAVLISGKRGCQCAGSGAKSVIKPYGIVVCLKKWHRIFLPHL